MSRIRNKISSIEADDDVVSKALGLHPVDDSKPIERIAPPEYDKNEPIAKASVDEEPLPTIASRELSAKDTYAEPKSGKPVLIFGLLAAAWLIGSIVTSLSLFKISSIASFTPAQMGGLAFFILFPLLLLFLIRTLLRSLFQLDAKADQLSETADALMRVDETVVRRATEMSGVVKGEIANLNSGIDTALTRAATLQGVLDEQTEKLGQTSLAVEDKTQKITDRLTSEREALWSISNAFEEQMKVLSETLDTQTEKLNSSTKTAEQKIQEARVSVEGTASKINQTSDLVRNNTMEAASTLTDNQTEILRLSEQLKTRAEELDQIYQKHSHDLNAMIGQLKNEQEVLSQTLEERLSKMRDVSLSAQVSAERLTEASEAGRRTVTSLSEAAKLSDSAIQQRFSELEEMVKYSNAKAETISEQASRRVQDSLSQTRKEISRIEDDMMKLQEKLSATADMDADSARNPGKPNPAAFTPEEPKQSDVPAKTKRGILNIRPVDVDEETTKPVSAEPVSRGLVAGLRPAPSTEREILIDADVTPPELPAKSSDANLDLRIEDGLIRPVTPEDDDIPMRADETISRTLEQTPPSGSWWRGIFGNPKAGASAAVTSANKIDDDRTRSNIQHNESSIENQVLSHSEFLEILNANGLSPNAIIDDGTILSAIDARIDKGTKQMSITVINRIGEPIHHFDKLINTNEDLKAHAVNFAVKFHHSLSTISENALAMRQKFESEDGRLFLMCDAALNN